MARVPRITDTLPTTDGLGKVGQMAGGSGHGAKMGTAGEEHIPETRLKTKISMPGNLQCESKTLGVIQTESDAYANSWSWALGL